MHDWVFLGLSFVWSDGRCYLEFKDSCSNIKKLTAVNVHELSVPRKQDWGESVCVNSVSGPYLKNELVTLIIEMQSGDEISIVASEIEMPELS